MSSDKVQNLQIKSMRPPDPYLIPRIALESGYEKTNNKVLHLGLRALIYLRWSVERGKHDRMSTMVVRSPVR